MGDDGRPISKSDRSACSLPAIAGHRWPSPAIELIRCRTACSEGVFVLKRQPAHSSVLTARELPVGGHFLPDWPVPLQHYVPCAVWSVGKVLENRQTATAAFPTQHPTANVFGGATERPRSAQCASASPQKLNSPSSDTEYSAIQSTPSAFASNLVML